MAEKLEQKLLEAARSQDIGDFCLELAQNVNRWTAQHTVLQRMESEPKLRALYLLSDISNLVDIRIDGTEGVRRVADYSFIAKAYAVFADEFPSSSPNDNAKAFSLMVKGIAHDDEIEGGRIYNQGRALDRTGAIRTNLSQYFAIATYANNEQAERLHIPAIRAITWNLAKSGNPAQSEAYKTAKELAEKARREQRRDGK